MRPNRLAIALIAALTLGLADASSAWATPENPVYAEAAGEISPGSWLEALSEATNTQQFKGTGITINCLDVNSNSGAKLETEGKGRTSLVYRECSVETKPSCVVRSPGLASGTLETERMDTKLGWKTKAAAEAKTLSSTVTVLLGEATEDYVDIELSGTCPAGTAGSHLVTGTVAFENVAPVTLAFAHELSAPATALKAYWLNEGGSPKERKLKALSSLVTNLQGKIKISLVAGLEWGIV